MRELDVQDSGSRFNDDRFRTLIENATELISVVAPDGASVYESPSVERVLGYHPAELIGSNLLDRLHVDDRLLAERCLASCASMPGSIASHKLRYRHRDGSWRHLEIIARSVASSNLGDGIVINARDVTERETMEGQLAGADRVSEMEHVATVLARELNDVLTSIEPVAARLDRASGDGSIAIAADEIHQAVLRGRRITGDVLSFAHPAQPIIAPVDLREFVATIVMSSPGVLPSNISFHVDVDSVTVAADRPQLLQMIGYLLDNARDAMPRGGVISISARRLRRKERFTSAIPNATERCAVLTFQDTGEGISPEGCCHIFEPLYTTRPHRQGLGLALTQQIVKNHGGEIFVETVVGTGTTFHILLPLSAG